MDFLEGSAGGIGRSFIVDFLGGIDVASVSDTSELESFSDSSSCMLVYRLKHIILFVLDFTLLEIRIIQFRIAIVPGVRRCQISYLMFAKFYGIVCTNIVYRYLKVLMNGRQYQNVLTSDGS